MMHWQYLLLRLLFAFRVYRQRHCCFLCPSHRHCTEWGRRLFGFITYLLR